MATRRTRWAEVEGDCERVGLDKKKRKGREGRRWSAAAVREREERRRLRSTSVIEVRLALAHYERVLERLVEAMKERKSRRRHSSRGRTCPLALVAVSAESALPSSAFPPSSSDPPFR